MTGFSRVGGGWTEIDVSVFQAGWNGIGAGYARVGGSWVHVYDRDGDAPEFLSPVDALAVAGVTDSTLRITWDNPSQDAAYDDAFPRVRIPAIANIWFELDANIEAFTFGGLQSGTEYTAEVQVAWRENGILQLTSAIRSISGTVATSNTPIVTLPDPGDPDPSNPVVTFPEPGPSCYIEWQLSISDDLDDWSIIQTGTTLSGSIEIDENLQVPGMWHRICTREVCPPTPAGSFNCGEPWRYDCEVLAPSPDRFTDDSLLMLFPSFCGDQIVETISEEPAVPGSNFVELIESPFAAEGAVLALQGNGETFGMVAYGTAPQLDPAHRGSITLEVWPSFDSDVTNDWQRIYAYGGAIIWGRLGDTTFEFYGEVVLPGPTAHQTETVEVALDPFADPIILIHDTDVGFVGLYTSTDRTGDTLSEYTRLFITPGERINALPIYMVGTLSEEP